MRVFVKKRNPSGQRPSDGARNAAFTPLQAKRAVSAPGDAYEREADRVADQVMATPADSLFSHAPPQVQRFTEQPSGPAETAPASVDRVLAGPGRPLEPALREDMEHRFGHDFSRVRVHSGREPEQSAEEVNSHAYTVGSHIVFGAGAYAPGSDRGRRLIAHELTHVVQQRAGAPSVVRRAPKKPQDDPKSVPAASMVWVRYGQTDLSAEALRVRRADRAKSEHNNLVVVQVRWRSTDQPNKPWTSQMLHFWSDSERSAHSEHVMDEGLKKFREKRSPNLELEVTGIFSERQYCGTSSRNCQQLVYQKWPKATKEYAFNYQEEYISKQLPRADTERGQVAEKIRALRDSGKPFYDGPEERPRVDESIKSRITPPEAPKKQEEKAAKKTDEDPAAGKKPGDPPEAKKTDPPAAKKADPPAPAKPADPPAAKKPDPPAAKKPDPPAAKKPDPPATKKPDPPAAAPTGSPTAAVSPAVKTAQRIYTGYMSHVSSKLMATAAENPKDKAMADAIIDINHLLDAQAFFQNPTQFTAQYVTDRMLKSAFGRFQRQLAADQAQFFATFPDVTSFHRALVGPGTSLNDLQARYDQAVKNLRLPSARKTLVSVFMMLGVSDATPQAEIDQRKQVINALLARQPGFDKYVKDFDKARQDLAFGLMVVWNRMRVVREQHAELPAGFAAEMRRRADALDKVARILTEYVEQIEVLIALPGVGLAVYMFHTLASNFGSLGDGLRQFADRAEARQGQYSEEIARLEARASRLARLQGAYDAMMPSQSAP